MVLAKGKEIGCQPLFFESGCQPVNYTSALLYNAIKLFINFCCQTLSYYSGCTAAAAIIRRSKFKLNFLSHFIMEL